MRERVLVADDDEAILDGLRLILEDDDYEVFTSTDGPTVATVIALRPSVIFLDVWMSGEDGRDVCAALKADARTRDIPVILASANDDTRRIARECGADDVLLKPFELDEVLRLTEHHARRFAGMARQA